ncbi:MAG: DUF5989 family protein [Candidatus Micrarchaeota archaeon]
MIIKKLGVAKDLLSFLWKRKNYWLIPIVLLLLLFALIIILGTSTGLGPLIYPFI